MKIRKMAVVISLILLITAWLLTSFQIAIYGDRDYSFYKKEYEKYRVTEDLNMEMADVMDVTAQMMDYLIGKKPELSVITNVDGERKDFFNDQDRFHMGEVKDLFLGGLRIRNILVIAGIGILVILKAFGEKVIQIVGRIYFKVLGGLAAALAVFGALISMDFNRYFTIFHEIFFDNDLWLFDPATDYMIRMLPEGFFFDFVIRIGFVFCLGLAFISGIIWKIRITNKKNYRI